MRQRWLWVMILGAHAATAMQTQLPEPHRLQHGEQWVSGELLVQPFDVAAAGTVLRQHGAIVRRLLPLGWWLVHTPSDEQELMQTLLTRGVAAAERHARVHTLRHPNDTLFGDQWHHAYLGSEDAWEFTIGRGTQRIGIIDTGLWRNHVDLRSRDKSGYDFISDSMIAEDGDGRDADYSDEGDGGDDCPEGEEDSWHGTHVSGLAASTGNNRQGGAGVSWRAKVVTARALGRCGEGNVADMMEAMGWLAGLAIEDVPPLLSRDRAEVINISAGSQRPCSQFEANVIAAVLDRGVSVVAAAGNDGFGADMDAPARCPGVISVGAVGPDGSRADYSSNGDNPTLYAPGGDFNADGTGDGMWSSMGGDNRAYAALQGTSMAAPIVAGAISLMRSLDGTLGPDDIEERLVSSGFTCVDCDDVAVLQLDITIADIAAEVSSTGGIIDIPELEQDPIASPGGEQDPPESSASCHTTGAWSWLPLWWVWPRRRHRVG
jgi:subtilisin family serine protease